MAVEIVDTLDFLLGAWTLQRTIDDHEAQARMYFTGTAELTQVGTGAHYAEAGQLITPSHTGSARRSLALGRLTGGSVGVDFGDGRPFFDLDLSTGAAVVRHPCGQDLYELAFEVEGADALVEVWRVSGPAKHYHARTSWHRVNPQTPPVTPSGSKRTSECAGQVPV